MSTMYSHVNSFCLIVGKLINTSDEINHENQSLKHRKEHRKRSQKFITYYLAERSEKLNTVLMYKMPSSLNVPAYVLKSFKIPLKLTSRITQSILDCQSRLKVKSK